MHRVGSRRVRQESRQEGKCIKRRAEGLPLCQHMRNSPIQHMHVGKHKASFFRREVMFCSSSRI